MHIIELDAARWKKVLDFYDALLAAVGAPKGHGRSVDGLIDSMIWGGMNAIDPPYTVRILDADKLPKDVREEIELVKRELAEARTEFRKRKGRDVEVNFEIEP